MRLDHIFSQLLNYISANVLCSRTFSWLIEVFELSLTCRALIYNFSEIGKFQHNSLNNPLHTENLIALDYKQL